MTDKESPVLGRRYVLLHALNRGGMGSVYRAKDRLTGQMVALKRVRLDVDTSGTSSSQSTTVDSRLALAGEFRLLASLRHPNVISVLDYGFDDEGLPFYTMDLLQEAQTILQAGVQAPFEEQIQLLIQVLQAVAYMHQRGIVHRDLKPQNILVTDGIARVLDFGLSTMFEHTSIDGTIGTLAYMAPEVVRGEPATLRADLYAIGVIAYEMLTGIHPFLGSDANDTIRNILYGMPDLISAGLDMRVAIILDRALAKDPAERQASAAEMIADFNQLLAQPVAPETAATRESFLQAARLVGRGSELKLLTGALASAMASQGDAWLIGGESGVGKSRLIDEVATLAMVQGALVLRGQAIESGGSPFQLWRGPLRWLGLLCEPDAEDIAVLARVLPEVATARGITVDDDTPSSTSRQLPRVVQRLIASQKQPVVLILEDLQWAGSESLSLLEQIAQTVPSLPLLIIASFRDDERADLPALLPRMRALRLGRLSPDEIAALSEAMLGSSGRSPEVVDLLRRETEGNVFFLIEVVRALAEEAGRLDQVSAMALPEHVFTGGVDRIIQRRLQAVPSEARGLLKLAAVAGRELDLDLLHQLAPAHRTEHWLSVCIDAAVVEFRDGQWRFTHDKLRHGLLASIDHNEQRDLHGRVATGLEMLYPDAVGHYAALSYHWAQAEIPAKEADYAGLAGQEALRSSAYREAIHFIQRALAIRTPRTEVWTARLYRCLGEAQAAIGEYDEATSAFKSALAITRKSQDVATEANVLYSLGDVAYALEQFEEAEAYYKASMACSEALHDASGVMRALSSLGNVAYDLDDYERANSYYKQSLALSRELGSSWGMAGSFGAAAAEDMAG
jgi:tetratricopeptide (TPR) repeat protein